ncbi:MAG: PAS domain-containing sensor histidine kinase [Thermodesulfobacteriota bacterium]|nr:MAG: PAS domain-containing sensor histidine kinase [Thermodesulfobacteriota bacterium]
MSIFWKQFISSFLIIVLVLFIFTFLIITELNKYDKSLTKERLLTAANLSTEVLTTSLENPTIDQVQSVVSKLGEKTGVRITVIDHKGVVLGDTDKNPREMENHSERPEIKQAFNNETGESSRYSSTLQKEMFYIAVPYQQKNGENLTVIRTSLPLSIIQQTLLPLESKVIYMGIAMTILALLLSLAVSKTTTKSLSGIISISEELAKGNLNVDIPITDSKGEIPKITMALNHMAQKLNEVFIQLSNEKNQLEAVLSAMSEGVMVISEKGNIIIINDALKEMFNLSDDPFQKPYWEILRNREVIKLIDGVLENWKPDNKEVFYLYPEERYYLANVIPLKSAEKKVIVVMFDITEFKRLENIKADFIANVSHELRTPLTAIKGYTETLEEDAFENPQEQKHFLKIIKRHADRLINIVSDLLVLSEVEGRDSLSNEDDNGDFEDVNVDEVIRSSLEALKSNAADKNLRVSFKPSDNDHIITASRFLLEQMFINLIDNAVKYTPDNGEIGIEITDQDKDLLIEIHDTGIGIPKESLPRIFERFYRVDKTRSRKMGGTGLGLSIVKHIVIIHGGKIDVNSEEGKGSKFCISLPKKV